MSLQEIVFSEVDFIWHKYFFIICDSRTISSKLIHQFYHYYYVD